jgi:hypothetical protein
MQLDRVLNCSDILVAFINYLTTFHLLKMLLKVELEVRMIMSGELSSFKALFWNSSVINKGIHGNPKKSSCPSRDSKRIPPE